LVFLGMIGSSRRSWVRHRPG